MYMFFNYLIWSGAHLFCNKTEIALNNFTVVLFSYIFLQFSGAMADYKGLTMKKYIELIF